jgi:hypothetical protein
MKRFLHAVQVLVLGFAVRFAAPFQNGSFEGCGGTNQFSIISGIPADGTAGNVDWETKRRAPSAGSRSLDLVGTRHRSRRAGVRYDIWRDVPGVLRSRRQLCKPADDQASTRGARICVSRDYSFNTTGKSRTIWVDDQVVRIHRAHGEQRHLFRSDLGTFLAGDAGAALDNVQILQLTLGRRAGRLPIWASPLVLRQPCWRDGTAPPQVHVL